MKFTLKWLKQFLNTNASLKQITETLNLIGLEVDAVTDKGEELKDFEVAKIKTATKHPHADNLKLCTVESSIGELEIVCGAPNARDGIKVVLAKVGTIIPVGDFKIKRSKIRGVESNGMLCSEKELGLGDDASGIIELPEEAEIGGDFSKYYGLDDPVIEIDLTPNRGDCLGVYGIARDLAACGLGELRLPAYQSPAAKNPPKTSLEVKDNTSCPLFIAREFRGVENQESPEWLQNYLKNIGLEPISALVDITNYIAYSYGRPLHVYDADKLNSPNLVIDKAEAGENFTGLDNNNYETAGGEIVVRDGKMIQAFGGVIGASSSGCSLETRNIILESALFNPVEVAGTGRYHGIESASRYRFERGVDANFTMTGAEIASSLIAGICGGEASEYVTSNGTEFQPREIEFSPQEVLRRSGTNIPPEKIQEILWSLGFEVNSGENQQSWNLKVPSWRNDISIVEDIVEEVTRIYGYNNLVHKSLPLPESAQAHRLISVKQDKISTASRLMASVGYNELVTWSFMDRSYASYFADINEELRLVNPIASNLDYMRPSIIPNLLNAAATNLSRSISDFALFEIGPVFSGTSGDKEITKLEAIRLGKAVKNDIHTPARDVDIYDIKADLEQICHELKIPFSSLNYNLEVPGYYHPGKSARLLLGNKEVAKFGQIHPTILKQFGIKEQVVALELNFENIPNKPPKSTSKGEYSVSKYQKVTRDFAFVMEEHKMVKDLTDAISGLDKKLIKNVEIFDIYKGENIEPGYKSVALNVEIQADDHTLEDSELSGLSTQIINKAAELGASLRE
jgi:phenylalanyl-tRNA synthetase beta chain